MARFYWDFDFVTSLVDYYGFRDKGDRTVEELEEHLTERTHMQIDHECDPRRVFPYVQRHEFEGLLFSDVSAFSKLPDAPKNLQGSLSKIRSEFSTPENINDNPNTAPSKRIGKLIPGYHKIAGASVVAKEIGLATIRAECPRFGAWVNRLESLGAVGK